MNFEPPMWIAVGMALAYGRDVDTWQAVVLGSIGIFIGWGLCELVKLVWRKMKEV